MARPEVSALAEVFYEAMGFHRDRDEENDWALLKFCAAWVSPLDPVYELVRERDDAAPWGILLDPDRCPAECLSYLAQWVGVLLTPEMTEADRRTAIREPTGWARGREPAVRIAALPTLTGTRRIIIRSRTPEVGIHYIRTLASETPDPERTRAALRDALPAWEVLNYEALAGVTWADVAAGWEDWAAVAAEFESWADLADLLPDELPEP